MIRKKIRSLLCSLVGHGGVDENGYCKNCRRSADVLPRVWRKEAKARAANEVRSLLKRIVSSNSSTSGSIDK